ncbi:MAG: sugar ABC transporter substrate-binding protein, partial [Thermomicrobiales bacterium]|nr:sugar ABC transporter substrate-binding protein [Thermomicrobiales bacterium]
AGLAGAAAFGRTAFAQDENAVAKTGVDPEKWNTETINALAGTITVDTQAELHALVPPDQATGDLSYWNVGPVESTPEIVKQFYQEFQDNFKTWYPNINLDNQNVDYNDLLDKLRTASAGGAAPDVAKMPILWGVEFAARGDLQEIVLEDYGLSKELFWEGALKSVTWEGKYYGIPTNNETMAFIWNKAIFAEAGLDPENPPATWADVVAYSKQIKDTTGKFGYGMVAKVNAGNTPFRVMPMLWAYGSSALDEAESAPTMKTTMINNEGGVAALQNMYDMYVRDRSVPTSALTNTQVENQDLFISGQVAMMISHPSEYVTMQNKLADTTGDEAVMAQTVVDNMAYGLIPAGPVRRSVVFGGSNAHIFTDQAHGGAVNANGAKALVAALTSPEWSLKNNWADSNPANLRGFETEYMKQRLSEIRFLEVTTSMLPYGVPFPVVPESTEIMNIIVPEMLQNALTETMSVQEAADDAAARIMDLISTT